MPVKMDIRNVLVLKRLIEEIRNARGLFNINPKENLEVIINCKQGFREFIEENIAVIKGLAGIKDIVYDTDPDRAAASVVMPDINCYIMLSGIDIAKEKKRLKDEITALSERIDEIKYRLNNPNYIQKATDEVKQREQKRLKDFLGKKEGIARAIERL